jgi:hypothetical protein
MVRTLPVLIVLSVLAVPSYASAGCRRLGTQLECDLAESRIVIGTQAAGEDTPPKSPRPQGLDDADRLPNDRAALPFALQLQDIHADASLCRSIENESYCD